MNDRRHHGLPPLSTLAVLFLGWSALFSGCGPNQHLASSPDADLLQMMSLSADSNTVFEADFFRSFSAKRHVKTQYLSDAGGTVTNRLELYQRLFREHSTKPDLVAVDVVWPAILANDLVDLRPLLGDDLKSFSPDLLSTFTVDGRIVAIPTFTDVGLLYYRRDLLEKYGFRRPPSTWDELENMARVIQAGERRNGHPDFWGFTWQGGPYEALTCNALEWQASAGAGQIIAPDGRIQVRDPAFLKALSRAARWIGTISPLGEYAYREPDSGNLWKAGQVAFMRHWASSYKDLTGLAGNDPHWIGVAPLPGGPGGRRNALGGQGVGISKHASNRKQAIEALLELTNEKNDLARVFRADSLPVRTANQNRLEVKNKSALHSASAALMRDLALRPAVVAGSHYDEVSRAYYTAINAVLRRRQQPAEAMEALEAQLQKILQTTTK